MIYSLLKISPDNTPGGFGGIDTMPLLIWMLAILAVIVTVCAAYAICKLYIKAYPNGNKKFIIIGAIVVTLGLIAFYILFAYFGIAER